MTGDREPHILVVEDERAVRESVDRVLTSEAVRVAFAEDLQSAESHPWRATCAAVLCDLKLPDGSGLELLRLVRAERPGLPFIITTGFATADTLAEARDAGATDVLLKPFDDAELVEAVSRALAAATPATQEDKP